MDLDIDDGIEQIKEAYLKDATEKLYKQYLVDYQNMDTEHFKSFDEYKKIAFKPKEEQLNKEDILVEAERIKNLDQGRR